MAISIVYLTLGLTVTLGAIIRVVADPVYWEPVTTVDFIAVWTWSLAFVLLGVAVPLLVRDARGDRAMRIGGWVVAAAAVLTAVANGIEDGLDQEAWGSVYVVGSLTTLGGMLALIWMLARGGRGRYAWVLGLWLVGLAMTTWGLGVLALIGSVVAIDARRRRDVVVA
jgi:hypothetical protein